MRNLTFSTRVAVTRLESSNKVNLNDPSNDKMVWCIVQVDAVSGDMSISRYQEFEEFRRGLSRILKCREFVKVICFHGTPVRVTEPIHFPYIDLNGTKIPVHEIPRPGISREGLSIDSSFGSEAYDSFVETGLLENQDDFDIQENF